MRHVTRKQVENMKSGYSEVGGRVLTVGEFCSRFAKVLGPAIARFTFGVFWADARDQKINWDNHHRAQEKLLSSFRRTRAS